MEHVHFVGIGGTGLSAIARYLHEKGLQVSGSDRQRSTLGDELARTGVRIYIGHQADQIDGADVVVRSSAVPDDNPEIQAALGAGIPVLKRSEFLPRMLADEAVIAVAGTHGKTTTTAMIAWTLKALGEDPSYIIGSIALNLGANAHAGQGRNFVIEADEYDHMFLGLHPQVAVITTIEHDHPDFFPTPESFFAAFEQFVATIRPEGYLVVCRDDPGVLRLLEASWQTRLMVRTYSLETGADFSARELQPLEGRGYSFKLYRQDEYQAEVSLQVPGRHNVYNALAAMAVIEVLGLPLSRAAGALSAFKGTARRFELLGEPHGIAIIDDYAHHPTEIRATLQAARRRYPGRRIWVVWQPHTYSRVRRLIFDFSHAFDQADRVIVTDIYAARETPPVDGFSSVDVVNVIQHPAVQLIPDIHDAAETLTAELAPGDVLLVLSAGDADQISRWVLAALEAPEKENHG